jgi:hypothetical protein
LTWKLAVPTAESDTEVPPETGWVIVRSHTAGPAVEPGLLTSVVCERPRESSRQESLITTRL